MKVAPPILIPELRAANLFIRVTFSESELAILGNNGCFQADVEVMAMNTFVQARRGGASISYIYSAAFV